MCKLIAKNDFKTKEIYKERYDSTDVAEHAIKFKNQRKGRTLYYLIEKIQNLVDFSTDETFKGSRKSNLELRERDHVDRGVDRESKIKQFRENFVTKEKWFNDKKFNDYGRAATADTKFVKILFLFNRK